MVAEALQQLEIFYISGYNASLVSTITSEYVYTNWLNNSDWTPNKVHTAPQYPNRVYVETNGGVWVLGFAFTEIQAYFFSYIPLLGSLTDDGYGRDIQCWGDYMMSIEASTIKASFVL